MDREILAASKTVESPPKPAIKLNLIEESDRVAPLDNSPTNHSTVSTSSTETLLTARERSHTELNISNSKSPLCSEKLENQTSPVKEIDENQNVPNQSEPTKTLVFSLDSDTGTYLTTDNENTNRKESLGKGNDDGIDIVADGLKEESRPEIDSLHHTDEDDDILKLKKSRHKRSDMSNKSGEGNRSSLEKSPDSDNEDGQLNTTDELIAASMGLIKLGTSNEQSTSVISDQLDESSKAGISVGTDSSSGVLRDASRLYENDDRVEKVRGSLSDLDTKSSHMIGQKKDLVNLFSDGAKSESFNRSQGLCRQFNSHNDSVISDQSSDFENDIKEEDVSHILKTSLNQFLSSRLSKSRNLEDSANMSNLSGLINNSDSRTNGYDNNNFCAHGKYSTPITNELDVMNDYDNGNNYSSPSLKSFEHHEKGVRYMTKSRNGSKSSDYSSQESVIFPEGSFNGQCKHRDSSYLGG